MALLPMTEPIARAVLDALGPGRAAPSAAQCRKVVEAWLRARGVHPVGRHNAWQVSEAERYYAQPRVLLRQRRREGEWRSFESWLYGDLALELLAAASAMVGDAAAAARVARAAEGRVRKAEDRVAKATAETLDAAARGLAYKRAAGEFPAEALDWGRALTGDGSALARSRHRPSGPFGARIAEGLPIYRAQMAALGGTPPDDGVFFSTAHPPVLPLHLPGADASWTEVEDGVPYSVRVRHRESGLATVEIGATRHGMGIDPVTLGARAAEGGVGDGYLSGYLTDRRAEPGEGARPQGPFVLGGVLAFVVATVRRAGSGARLMALWCRLLEGYGIGRWVALAAGDEGLPFLQALAARGRLVLENAAGRTFLVRTGAPAHQPLLPGVRPNPGVRALWHREGLLLSGAVDARNRGHASDPDRLAATLRAAVEGLTRLAPLLGPDTERRLAAVLTPEVRHLLDAEAPRGGSSRLDQLHALARALLSILEATHARPSSR